MHFIGVLTLALWTADVVALPAGLVARNGPLLTEGSTVGYEVAARAQPGADPPRAKPAPTSHTISQSVSPSDTDAVTSILQTAAPNTGHSMAKQDKIRGVNLGGWLVLEKWMTPDVFQGPFANAMDQWTFDEIQGSAEALEEHWSTFITEKDIAQLASWGINTLRIPIGYWAYNHTTGAPYKSGADKYLDQALQWSRTHKLRVLIDLHGVPGSQNGFDNSGQAGKALWQQGDNMRGANVALEQIAAKYGSQDYADVVWGIQLVNEPISWSDPVNPQKTHEWAQSTFRQLQSSQPSAYKIIMHDAFETTKKWEDLGKELNANSTSDPAFWIDTHLYQNQVDEDSKLNQEQHIEKACKWATTHLLPNTPQVPVIVGEFSAQTNVCVNPDGTSIAGKQCSTQGCQCSVEDMAKWRQPMKDATTKFLEAELDTFEGNAAGWFLWSYKAPGTWGLANLMDHGILGKTVTNRKFPGQCQQYSAA
ncbi:hypothetical protein CAC42_3810 [Sphaceloma murrayae]|uniref:glucan 1,3-beta-glucosidase n=1 Tax=Sphaceloma murrayae TaxID=2082308 RepID=A0A2K1QH89_9PEZI|nr:hypothetical protein CAC42_3810 [Sphaceloma murrayae]